MGTEEDRPELFGAPLDREIARMLDAGRCGRLVQDQRGEWKLQTHAPPKGTPYVEVFADGEVRKYFNTAEKPYGYRQLRKPKRTHC